MTNPAPSGRCLPVFGTTPRPPFAVVPWDRDFFHCLTSHLLEATEGHPEQALVVFMHERPRRYLTERLRRDPAVTRPFRMPIMLSVGELFARLGIEWGPPLRQAQILDQVALLARVVRDEVPLADSDLAHMDEATFFPWGMRLAALFEECFTQGLTPDDLYHTEGEVEAFAAALLARLRCIFDSYTAALEAEQLTTPGHTAFLVMKRLRENPPLPPVWQGKHIFLAGFTALTGSEEAVFRHLWEQGARVFLHSDPALAQDNASDQRGQHRPPHWSCQTQIRWMTDWNTTAVLACPPSGRTPRIHFFAGYDLHSQLETLRADRAQAIAPFPEGPDPASPDAEAAIVLPHADALLPTLHHLGDEDCNVSLGYPLNRTLIFHLLDTICALRDGRRDDGSLPWRELVALLRHPYLRMLQRDGESLRAPLASMEQHLRTEGGLVQIDVLLKQAADLPEAAAELLQDLLDRCIHDWAQVQSLHDLALRLEALAQLLLHDGAQFWSSFPVDAEGLFRLIQRLIPTLRDTRMAATPLPWPLLRHIFAALMEQERVPFEADPVIGLQVLGMLETRLLRFDRVFIPELTDDHLPGSPARNPLLPDTLRHVLGLPDAQQSEVLAAHTFTRLLAGAREVFLYWQEGVEPGLFDGKKQRSRFVESLIWAEEQARKTLLKPGQPPLRAAEAAIRPPRRQRTALRRSAAMQAAMETFLRRPLSATTLDSYLLCPLRFYYERLCRLTPPDAPPDGDNPVVTGKLVHEVLLRLYTPWKGRLVSREELHAPLDQIFRDVMAEMELARHLPPESVAMLAAAGPFRLHRFLKNQPEQIQPLHLETSFTVTFDPSLDRGSAARTLTGILDRVDLRPFPETMTDAASDGKSGAVILDYKTGRVRKPSLPPVLDDETLWSPLSTVLHSRSDAPFADPHADLLPFLAARIPSLQLMHYVVLYSMAETTPVLNAAFADLAGDGREIPLIHGESRAARAASVDADTATTQQRHTTRLAHCHALLAYILRHMEQCPEFRPRESAACGWCSCKNACIR